MANYRRRSIIGWMLYDWANSAFALTVLTAFFPILFKKFWCAGFDPSFSTVRLNFGNAVAGMCIALAAPFLGALADAGHNRKRFLMWFMVIGVLATGLLSSIPQGAWLLALVVFVIAAIGFDCANLFYDSLLPAVAPREKMDLVSSGGYAVGYVGGGLLFVVNVLMIMHPHLFGLADKSAATRTSFQTVSIWWLLFSLPLLLLVREDRGEARRPALQVIAVSLRHLRATFEDIRGHRQLWLFLLAYWLYIDGVHTFITSATDLGLSIGLSDTGLMFALIVVQFVAFPASYAFGLLSQRIGTLLSLGLCIALYAFVSVAAPLTVRTQTHYTLFAALQAIPLGALQALSRSYYARMIPAEKSAEYFGFYSLMGKFAAVIGPAMVALVALTVRSSGGTAASAARWGCASITLLFVAGGVLLALSARSPRDQLSVAAE